MKINNHILLFYVLPTLAPLILPPQTLLNGIGAVLVAAALLLATGYFLQRGKPLALTFLIFLQGLNFIVKMMMFFSNSVSDKGVANPVFAMPMGDGRGSNATPSKQGQKAQIIGHCKLARIKIPAKSRNPLQTGKFIT